MLADKIRLAHCSKIPNSTDMNRWLPAILIFTILIVFRVMAVVLPGSIQNFQPLPSMVLCSFVFLKGYQRWLIPLAAWLVTDPLTSALHGYPLISPKDQFGVLLGVGAMIAIALKTSPRPTSVLVNSLLSAVAFYFITNCVSFTFDPLYPKTLQGFIQAQWTGPIGFGPTWIFLKNLALGNLVFTGIFLLARKSLPQPHPTAHIAPAR